MVMIYINCKVNYYYDFSYGDGIKETIKC